jgi:hypothetical protein
MVLLCAMLLESRQWSFAARIVPQIVGTLALVSALLSALNAMFRRTVPAPSLGMAERAQARVAARIHMDLASETSHLPAGTVVRRAAAFFAWFLAFMATMAVIGLIPTVPVFVIAYMRSENREPWTLVLMQAVGLTAFVYVVFHRLLTVPWPETVLGTWFPVLKWIPSL